MIDSKHYGNEDEWYTNQPRGVKEVSISHMDSQIYELTNIVLLLTKEKIVAKKQCSICLKTENAIDMCPLLKEVIATVKAVRGYQK